MGHSVKTYSQVVRQAQVSSMRCGHQIYEIQKRGYRADATAAYVTPQQSLWITPSFDCTNFYTDMVYIECRTRGEKQEERNKRGQKKKMNGILRLIIV